MASEWAVLVEGLDDLSLDQLNADAIKSAASKAINKIATSARAKGAREVRRQVNLPARFVSPNSKGLYVSQKASPGSLQGTITARGRPTSLARFVKGSPRQGKAGVYIEVAPGKARFMKRAFLIPLRGVGGSTELGARNMGLAIRLRAGERLKNKVDARRIANGLYALYGPSVDQVFRSRDGTGVANDLVPDIEQDLPDEFIRLLEL